MKNSKIEWTDHTFNPWWGCVKVSPACAHCYAATFAKRVGLDVWGPDKPRRFFGDKHWEEPLKWNENVRFSFQQVTMKDGTIHRGYIPEIVKLKLNVDEIAMAGPARPRVFCASMADVFEDYSGPTEEVLGAARAKAQKGTILGGKAEFDEARARLFKLIFDTPNLDWLLLTKRPENFGRVTAIAHRWHDLASKGCKLTKDRLFAWMNGNWHPENVWVGTTVENQEQADKRIPALLRIPARVRFLSCEPLLSEVLLDKWLWGLPDPLCANCPKDIDCECGFNTAKQNGLPSIDWVICGGESGAGARPMHPEWARGLRDQCQSASVPFFFKQWGDWWPMSQMPHGEMDRDDRKDAKKLVLQLDGEVAMKFPPGAMTCVRVGKQSAGRMLDGREWNEVPQ